MSRFNCLPPRDRFGTRISQQGNIVTVVETPVKKEIIMDDYQGYSPDAQNLAAKQGDWTSCRERFHQAYRKGNTIWYAPFTSPYYAQTIYFYDKTVALLDDIEKRLCIPPENGLLFTSFYNNRGVLKISNLSGWWNHNRMRVHLLTALLRASRFCAECGDTDKTVKRAFAVYGYGGQAYNAFELFMQGYTYPGKSYRCWFSTFGHGSTTQISNTPVIITRKPKK